MVQGVKTKIKKSPSVQLNYVIDIIEIKPWPPSQSLRSIRSALIQWEHGEKNSGTTKAVTPLLVSSSGVGDGKIEFNESFKLNLTLLRELSIKAGDGDVFLKNCIEFNMYEPRRDKSVKGQLLATAVVDFAEYGVVKDGLMISVPMNCKRAFSNTVQPMLFLKIEAFDKNNRVRSASMDRNSSESVVNGEHVEETESTSVTDDDVSSQSSMAATSLTSRPNVSSNPQKSVAESVAETDEDTGSVTATESRIGDVVGKQSFISNTDESQNEQKSQIMGDEPSISGDRFRKVKSTGSSLDSSYNNGSWRSSKIGEKVKDVSKLQQLEHKVQSLEGELREAAAIEVGLYSIVAEHGSSISKVHAPARRLSRLYLHACKENSQSRRASSARSIVSGLILVAKACGNDVPRLTFWMSNCVVLRAIIYVTFEQEHKANSSSKKRGIKALEKVESWIFSRIIESVWWQTLTPYMQSAAAKAIVRIVDSESSKSSKKASTPRSQEQANFSMELWKTAFMDACERICPVRAEGHDCGCLPVLSRLVMEQCMARLDVAMFNAVLRESADEAPTDPVSDPISDARVLPISSGKASFGAGAQLKNAIGNWSRWLTDLFGIDDDDVFDDENDDVRSKDDASFKSFHLLNALSDLMMLPKDMLLSSTVRKEVCPTFGAPLIKKILDTFVPDEFCPDPIPAVVLEALDSEDSFEGGEDCVTSLPCAAASVVYHPPPASSIRHILGEGVSRTQLTRSGSIMRKSNTSDDELDELSSPLTAIIDNSRGSRATSKTIWRSKDTGSQSNLRYKLLKEVWVDNE
ncbi:putative NT-type C2 domain, nucleoporin [Helianthus annuus]|nr:putative NT-type C2 domain, nucleoporin [Helianthus annuus]KAJ0534275.1 putative NT-type C2 domain-containing protein [Helianthus annuus]KAJ0542387.1 putative NT-type C2 domain, nucleoporin [Helianthus annuus]